MQSEIKQLLTQAANDWREKMGDGDSSTSGSADVSRQGSVQFNRQTSAASNSGGSLRVGLRFIIKFKLYYPHRSTLTDNRTSKQRT